jgi:hypothetical protein
MLQNIKRIYQEETMAQRGQRMVPAAIYAVLVATLYVLAFTLVNTYTFRNLPLGIDWLQVLKIWIGLAISLALFAAIATWFTEEYEGIVGGAVITTALIFLVLLVRARASQGTSAAQPIVTVLPLLGVGLLGAWAARWIAHRHIAVHNEKEDLRRKAWTRYILIVCLIGLVPGILGRMDSTSEYAIRQLHELLQAAPADPSVLPRLPLKQVPSLQEHLGKDYVLYARQSTLAVGALDVTVRFSDGYAMTCLLPVGSGNTFITDCSEGTSIQINP